MKNRLRKLAALVSLATSGAPVFAQDIIPAGMNTLMESIISVFTGPFVKSILVICLCGCAVAYGFNKDNEKMKRNCIAIGVAVALLIGASAVVNAIWAAAEG
jgi:type IV secretory pathway VirB2 component (pilin)